MKLLPFPAACKFMLLTAFCFTQDLLWAQDSSQSQAHTVAVTEKTGFVMQPWMWIVAGIILLAIIIGMFKAPQRPTAESTAVARDMDVS